MPDMANIGKSVVIRGELSGSENLFLDGEVDGSIEMKGHSLTIGPNGHIRAHVHAKEVIVHGRVDGNLHASDRVELRSSAVLTGDIFTQRIRIEDGAFFKGSIDIQKAEDKAELTPEPHKEAAAAVAHTPTFTPTHTPPLIESK